MELTLINVLDLLGTLLSIVFIVIAIRGSRSLIGSFFKHYYRYMIAAAFSIAVGMFVEPVGDWLELPEIFVIGMHDVALIVASALFIYASTILPKDAAAYMKSQHTSA